MTDISHIFEYERLLGLMRWLIWEMVGNFLAVMTVALGLSREYVPADFGSA